MICLSGFGEAEKFIGSALQGTKLKATVVNSKPDAFTNQPSVNYEFASMCISFFLVSTCIKSIFNEQLF